MIFRTATCLSLLWAATGLFASPTALEEARSATREWVNAEKTLSLEASEWESRKILLQDLIAIREKQLDQLDQSIADAGETSSQADTERRALIEREDVLKAQATQISSFLARIEPELRDLKPRLPQPLQEELEPLYQRLPQDPASQAVGIGQRMQTVTQILSGIREFNSRITLSESVQELPSRQTEAVVQTLWLGLGQAYYLAPDDAGYGVPGADGWVWHSQPDLSRTIRESIELVQGGKASSPRWISLPVSLSTEAAQ